ncbi:putative Angio-associated migratory cell protein [Blattamonas nauphoetae]|uniref:Angio-associated migratory cell protein n=1 Tax=Blattamonas nauphoetae TaxID=2049346 RepID=A0ABQ9XS91_9EUKA|nr:putative Angio-associated migratory cell protein [Blattamonas nauphoetae]
MEKDDNLPTPSTSGVGYVEEYVIDKTDLMQDDDSGSESSEESNSESGEVEDTPHFIPEREDALMDWSPSSQNLVATGGEEEKVFLWDVESEKKILTIPDNDETLGESVSIVSFSPNGAKLAFCTLSGSVQIWDMNTKAKLLELDDCDGEINFLQWNAGSQGLVAGDSNSLVYIWSATTGNCRVLAGHQGAVTCGTFIGDGQTVITGSENGALILWSVRTAEKLGQINTVPKGSHEDGSGVMCVKYNANHPQLVMYGKSNGNVGSAIVPQCTLGHTFLGIHSDSVENIVFSPQCGDMHLAASISIDSTVSIFDVKKNQVRGNKLVHPDTVTAAFFHPTLPHLITACFDGIVRVWDVTATQCIASFVGHSAPIQALALSPDGRRAVTGSDDKTARVFDLEARPEETE